MQRKNLRAQLKKFLYKLHLDYQDKDELMQNKRRF